MKLKTWSAFSICLGFFLQSCSAPKKVLGTDSDLRVVGSKISSDEFHVSYLGSNPSWRSIPSSYFYKRVQYSDHIQTWTQTKFNFHSNLRLLKKPFHHGLEAYERPYISLEMRQNCKRMVIIFPLENGNISYAFIDPESSEVRYYNNKDSRKPITGKTTIDESTNTLSIEFSVNVSAQEICSNNLIPSQ